MWCDCYNGVASFPFFSFLFYCTYLPITLSILTLYYYFASFFALLFEHPSLFVGVWPTSAPEVSLEDETGPLSIAPGHLIFGS